MNEKLPVKSYCGGVPNYCTPEVTPEVPCKTDPRAPHGFDRNASHSADRYVCECESWESVDAVNINDKCVHKIEKSVHEWVGLTDEDYSELLKGGWEGSLIREIEAKLKEKNT